MWAGIYTHTLVLSSFLNSSPPLPLTSPCPHLPLPSHLPAAHQAIKKLEEDIAKEKARLLSGGVSTKYGHGHSKYGEGASPEEIQLTEGAVSSSAATAAAAAGGGTAGGGRAGPVVMVGQITTGAAAGGAGPEIK